MAPAATRRTTAHLQLESVRFNGLDSRILAIYGAQPPGDGVHAVECGDEAQSIVDGNLGGVFREALHVNQAPRLVDDVPASRWDIDREILKRINAEYKGCVSGLQAMARHGREPDRRDDPRLVASFFKFPPRHPPTAGVR